MLRRSARKSTGTQSISFWLIELLLPAGIAAGPGDPAIQEICNYQVPTVAFWIGRCYLHTILIEADERVGKLKWARSDRVVRASPVVKEKPQKGKKRSREQKQLVVTAPLVEAHREGDEATPMDIDYIRGDKGKKGGKRKSKDSKGNSQGKHKGKSKSEGKGPGRLERKAKASGRKEARARRARARRKERAASSQVPVTIAARWALCEGLLGQQAGLAHRGRQRRRSFVVDRSDRSCSLRTNNRNSLHQDSNGDTTGPHSVCSWHTVLCILCHDCHDPW